MRLRLYKHGQLACVSIGITAGKGTYIKAIMVCYNEQTQVCIITPYFSVTDSFKARYLNQQVATLSRHISIWDGLYKEMTLPHR